MLEQLKTLESSESALAALRRHISRPTAMFVKYEALDLLQSLVRQQETKATRKRTSTRLLLTKSGPGRDALDHSQLQRLFLGLLGDPVRAKVAKEATTIFSVL